MGYKQSKKTDKAEMEQIKTDHRTEINVENAG